MLGLLYLSILLLNLGTLNLRRFQILGLPSILLAQEGTETDQVVLDQDILLTQLFLSDSAALLFPTIVKISRQRQLQLSIIARAELKRIAGYLATWPSLLTSRTLSFGLRTPFAPRTSDDVSQAIW